MWEWVSEQIGQVEPLITQSQSMPTISVLHLDHTHTSIWNYENLRLKDKTISSKRPYSHLENVNMLMFYIGIKSGVII